MPARERDSLWGGGRNASKKSYEEPCVQGKSPGQKDAARRWWWKEKEYWRRMTRRSGSVRKKSVYAQLQVLVTYADGERKIERVEMMKLWNAELNVGGVETL